MRISAFWAACVALALAGISGAALAQSTAEGPPIITLSAADARADLALMRRALETIHPGLYRRATKPEMDRAFGALESGVDGPVTDAELYRRIADTLARIRCTHTKAEQTEAMEAWRIDHAAHLPWRFRIIEGRMIVVSSDAAQTALPRGAEVLAINGRRAKALVDALAPYVSVDGASDWTRPTFLAEDSDLMGADFDHYYPYLFGFPETFEVRLRDGDRVRNVTLKPITFRQWTKLDNDGAKYRLEFGADTRWKMLDATTGYLSVPTFVNYRNPVDAAALYARALGELRAAGAMRLIVDLRENGGGSNDAALALIDALALQPYTYQKAARLKAVRYGDLPDYISTWGDRDRLFNPPLENFTKTNDGWYELKPDLSPDVLKPRAPAPNAFTGPVVVLTGPKNASGATMTIAKLKDMGRVTLVGGRSGGSADGPTAGTIFNVKLPKSGIAVRIPNAWNAMAVERFDSKGGMRPDIEVRETVADFRARRDLALERAIEVLGE
jgi:C-terminal processing protease CtpA/Prc